MPKITPFLWFNADAEAAAAFYLSVFPNSRTLHELHTPVALPGRPMALPSESPALLVVDIELDGQQITLLNGGPGHPPTEAFSLVVRCQDQAEIDRYWSLLTDGGSEVACGWLKDKFGVSWQVVPANLSALVSHPQGMQAMMSMKKLDIAALEKAASRSL